MVLILSKDDVRLLLRLEDAIEVVEESFKRLALGKVLMPLRSIIQIPKHIGMIGTMPAYLKEAEIAGLKIFTVIPNNPSKNNFPTTTASILLINPITGQLLALIEGSYLTAIRTGAASAVATRKLSKFDSTRIGIIGSGIQARFQLLSINKVRKIDLVSIYSPNKKHRKIFAGEMGSILGIDVKPVDSAKEVVMNSDIIVAATASKGPVIKGELLEDGVHINSIGSCSPDTREVDLQTINWAKVIVDKKEVALKEAGDFIIPISKGKLSESCIFAELGEILIRKKKGRTNLNEITLFKYHGLAVQDVLLSKRIYETAIQNQVGREVQL